MIALISKVIQNKLVTYSVFFFIILGIFLLIDSFGWGINTSKSRFTILTGCILLCSFLFADVINKIKLPRLTGYMLVGVLMGPMGFKLLTSETIDSLSFLENLALSLIAITAGGEFRFWKFLDKKKSILYILFFQILVVFIGTGILFIVTAQYFNFLSSFSTSIIIGFSILFAGAAISTSPAVTIGIITELRARGHITDLVLMVTVFKAVALVLLFPIIIMSAKYFLVEDIVFNSDVFLNILFQLGSSIFSGVILGFLTIWYLKKIRVEKSIFLFGLTIVITEVSHLWGMEILLTSIITGVVVQNFSEEGEKLISGIELFSLPLYVLFFSFAGASLHLDIILKVLPITIFLVIIRQLLIFLGNYFGSIVAKESKNVKKYSWLGYSGQAGIALGLGIIIERTFPGDAGQIVLTVLIATIVINELIGPIFFKYVLLKVNETNDDERIRKTNYSRV